MILHVPRDAWAYRPDSARHRRKEINSGAGFRPMIQKEEGTTRAGGRVNNNSDNDSQELRVDEPGGRKNIPEK
jgi:hypothetical protein